MMMFITSNLKNVVNIERHFKTSVRSSKETHSISLSKFSWLVSSGKWRILSFPENQTKLRSIDPDLLATCKVNER
jgi:hypothetical protein